MGKEQWNLLNDFWTSKKTWIRHYHYVNLTNSKQEQSHFQSIGEKNSSKQRKEKIAWKGYGTYLYAANRDLNELREGSYFQQENFHEMEKWTGNSS